MNTPHSLTAGRMTAYAMGGMAMNLTNLMISQWIFKRYAPTPEAALVPVALFSVFFFLGRITDAITDPLIAFWSDQCRSRRGRRIPFILYGTLPFAVIFFLLWTPPFTGRSLGNAIYILVEIQLYFIFYTLVVTPYLALIPEITQDARQRVNLTSLQAVFVTLGTIVFGLMGVIIEKMGWVGAGALVAAITVLSFLPTAFFIREKPASREAEAGDEKAGLITWVMLTLKNKPFIYLVVSTSFYWFGLNLMIMLMPYWVQDLLGRSENAVTLVMGPFLVMNIVFFFVFNLLAKRFGKYLMFMVTCLTTGLIAPALSLVGKMPFADPMVQTIMIMGLLGIPVAGFLMLPFAILSDVADHDARLTGKRREAIYFGVQAIFQKSMIGVSIFVFGLFVLGGQHQGISITGLKIIPMVAAASFLLAFAGFWGYPLRETDSAE